MPSHPAPRPLHLLRPPIPTPTPDLFDPSVAELIDQATAWSRTVMPIDADRDVPRCRHLRLVAPPLD